jgi:hypothetical protein
MLLNDVRKLIQGISQRSRPLGLLIGIDVVNRVMYFSLSNHEEVFWLLS